MSGAKYRGMLSNLDKAVAYMLRFNPNNKGQYDPLLKWPDPDILLKEMVEWTERIFGDQPSRDGPLLDSDLVFCGWVDEYVADNAPQEYKGDVWQSRLQNQRHSLNDAGDLAHSYLTDDHRIPRHPEIEHLVLVHTLIRCHAAGLSAGLSEEEITEVAIQERLQKWHGILVAGIRAGLAI